MRKILFLLLIAIIACNSIETFEQDELVLEGINFKSMWNKVKKNVKAAKAWLKSVGLYDPLVNAIKNVGAYYANNYCTSKGVPKEICSSIVQFLQSIIR